MSEQDPRISAFAKKIMREAAAGKGQDISTSQADNLVRSRKEAEEKATVQQIQETYGQHSAHILNQLHARYEGMAKSKPDTSDGTYFNRLSPEQQQAAIKDHRRKLAQEARAEAKQQYAESVRTYREKVEQRKAEAEAALCGHGDALSADVLARAALASDEELRNMARIASKTNHGSLKQAVLSVAADRGMGDALVEVFGDEERQLYQEIQQAPPTEVLERQTHDVNIDAVVPDVSPDVIMPPAKGNT